eukprot:gnl/TRDRNA2_/TRDRNA2_93044_c0_seq3.p1 gnl/TRDRNA2_/TRDRNA2_93044_c0~~gnl/TRDRNA2_/TRDRNA2_93044_c0_seq3.p1  ORF type:complete len:292 (+),score=43.24 gnl/TRDRNA2_/TRDRNA2_93044_c0_seq3:123-998(+)
MCPTSVFLLFDMVALAQADHQADGSRQEVPTANRQADRELKLAERSLGAMYLIRASLDNGMLLKSDMTSLPTSRRLASSVAADTDEKRLQQHGAALSIANAYKGPMPSIRRRSSSRNRSALLESLSALSLDDGEEERFKNVSAAGVVLWVDDQHILVGLGSNRKGGLRWMDFGGKRHPGETVKDCAAREFLEETGLDPEDLEIDWCAPVHIPICKYVFFQGWLGNHQPVASAELVTFTTLHINDTESDVADDFRLLRVLHYLRRNSNRTKPAAGTTMQQAMLDNCSQTSRP